MDVYLFLESQGGKSSLFLLTLRECKKVWIHFFFQENPSGNVICREKGMCPSLQLQFSQPHVLFSALPSLNNLIGSNKGSGPKSADSLWEKVGSQKHLRTGSPQTRSWDLEQPRGQNPPGWFHSCFPLSHQKGAEVPKNPTGDPLRWAQPTLLLLQLLVDSSAVGVTLLPLQQGHISLGKLWKGWNCSSLRP